MNDPVSDFLTRVRNASQARLPECSSPHSGMKEGLARILKDEGYIAGYGDGADAAGHRTLVVRLKYVDGVPALTGLKRVSTPGRRMYTSYSEIPRVLNGLGMAVLSTSRGLMRDRDARRQKLGGEIVCNVW